MRPPPSATEILYAFASTQRTYIFSRHLALWKRFQRKSDSTKHDDVQTEEAIAWFESEWLKPEAILQLMPGKDALSDMNQILQKACAISITSSGIISGMNLDEVPEEMKQLIAKISDFAAA